MNNRKCIIGIIFTFYVILLFKYQHFKVETYILVNVDRYLSLVT